MEVQEAIKRVLDCEGILFLGAGFSIGAINLRNRNFLVGTGIANHFADLSKLPKGTSLEDASEEFVQKSGTDALIREIQNEFTAKDVCDYHRLVASLPWKRVYTTNYDNVFELAAQQKNKRVTTVTMSEDIYKIPKDHTICVHLNGYVRSLDRQKIGSELKLTEASYVTASIAETSWAGLLRQDIKLASAVFFLGYSLYDLDIKRIIAETVDDKKKLFFYIGPTPDDATKRRASRYGNILTESTESFVSLTREVAQSYIPRDRSELRTISVREYNKTFRPKHIKDQDFIDLLLWGRRSNELLSESLRTNKPYYLKRHQVDEVFRQIESGIRVLVVCSDLGNGKSLFLDGLRFSAMELGFRVFEVYEHNNGVAKELETIARLSGKVFVTIEGYQNWLDEIRLFCNNAGDQAVLVLTVRNGVHDVMIDDLLDNVGSNNFSEINLDTLNSTEIEWIVDTLDLYGLWGVLAGEGKQKKIKHIEIKCQRQFHALLLKLLESPDIRERFSSLACRIKEKGAYYEQLLSILILAVLDYPPSFDLLNNIWGPESLSSLDFRKDTIIKELVSFNYHTVQVRSPIAAEYIIRSFSDSATLVSVLIRIAERIDKCTNLSGMYKSLFADLMRFGKIQTLFPERGKRNAVVQYYESLKNLRRCKNYPLFWLQYAIASLVINDLSRAGTYFDTAYSLAEKKGWDMYQIDNHFARFLMVQTLQKNMDISSALDNYRQASAIILNQIRNERRHYPYRVAILFQDFMNKYGNKMSKDDIEDFAIRATNIRTRIDQLPKDRCNHHYIVKCRKSMDEVNMLCFELLTAKRNSPPT